MSFGLGFGQFRSVSVGFDITSERSSLTFHNVLLSIHILLVLKAQFHTIALCWSAYLAAYFPFVESVRILTAGTLCIVITKGSWSYTWSCFMWIDISYFVNEIQNFSVFLSSLFYLYSWCTPSFAFFYSKAS